MNVFRRLCMVLTCLALSSAGFSDSSPSYIVSYNGNGSSHNTRVYSVDYSGNVVAAGSITASGASVNNGTETSNGLTVYAPFTQVVSSNTTVTPSATFQLLASTGSTVLLGGASCFNVALATATAINGQYLVLASTSTVGYVQISTGTQCGVIGPTATISLLNKAASFIFDQLAGVWKQIQQ